MGFSSLFKSKVGIKIECILKLDSIMSKHHCILLGMVVFITIKQTRMEAGDP